MGALGAILSDGIRILADGGEGFPEGGGGEVEPVPADATAGLVVREEVGGVAADILVMGG